MLALAALAFLTTPPDRLVFEGGRGPGKGKQIVLLSGDEEYRSEEGLPQLAKILSKRHGFKCTVLFSLNAKGEIDPNTHDNEPGLEALDSADLCVMLLRFRSWPDAQMKHFADYVRAGKPIIALRTSTHAFDYPDASPSPYREFGWKRKGGFGRQVLGETWISHWGVHAKQGTRGLVITDHPILRSVKDISCTTDVYEAHPPEDARVLVLGQVVDGLTPNSKPATGRKKTAKGDEQELNDPMMPIVWTREYRNEAGKTNTVLTTTMGAATDLLDENLRRLLVNGVFFQLGLKVPARADVRLVGPYHPSAFGFDGFTKGVKPPDLQKGG